MHMSSSYTYHVYELKKFKKLLKKYIHVFPCYSFRCIKFQRQITNNEDALKKTKKFDRSVVRNFSFLLQINYNEFNLEILYTGGV
jgi:hypothetical protein